MLALKLLLVPSFLLLLTLAGRRLGPAVAGWLAGLPVVTAPILYVLALEQGREFAADAAAASAAGMFPLVSFIVAYARAAPRAAWPGALARALLTWIVAAAAVTRLPTSPSIGLAVAFATLLAAPRFFPPASRSAPGRHANRAELLARMIAGAALTLAVSLAAAVVGSGWSGVLAAFPVLSTVLAVTTHRAGGAAIVSALLRAMVTGLYSAATFCATLSIALRSLPTGVAFALAVSAGVAAQAATRRLVATARRGAAP